jgi:predicted Zn-dependent protease
LDLRLERGTSDLVQPGSGSRYLKKHLTDNAIQIFRTLVKEKPNNPIFREHLSQALTQKEGKLAQNTRSTT